MLSRSDESELSIISYGKTNKTAFPLLPRSGFVQQPARILC